MSKEKRIILTISASQDEKEGTELPVKLPDPEVRYWVGLAAQDIRLASCKLEFNRSEEPEYIAGDVAGDTSEESRKESWQPLSTIQI